MESVKKSIDERALHKREYNTGVNERQMQTTEGKVDMCKALDDSLVNTTCSGTELKEQYIRTRPGNDAHADDHTEQPEFNNEGEVDQNADPCHGKFVRQPTAFKSERPRISKPRFASQVDVNNDLSKLVTTDYLPKERESVVAKPHHVIASHNSRNSSKNMPRFSSNDMVHNHYVEEARKKTQEKVRNSEPSVIPFAK
nr:hypothetical protein [Tanacetum cinerariifolium]